MYGQLYLATQTCNTPAHTEECKIHLEATSSSAAAEAELHKRVRSATEL